MILNLIIIRTMLCNIFRANRGYFSFFSCQGHLQSSNISIHDVLLSIFEGKLTSVLRSNLEYICLALFELSLFHCRIAGSFTFTCLHCSSFCVRYYPAFPFTFSKSRSSTVDVTRLLFLSLDRWTSCSCHQVVVVRVADVSKIKSGRNSSQHTPAWYALRNKHACNV